MNALLEKTGTRFWEVVHIPARKTYKTHILSGTCENCGMMLVAGEYRCPRCGIVYSSEMGATDQ